MNRSIESLQTTKTNTCKDLWLKCTFSQIAGTLMSFHSNILFSAIQLQVQRRPKSSWARTSRRWRQWVRIGRLLAAGLAGRRCRQQPRHHQSPRARVASRKSSSFRPKKNLLKYRSWSLLLFFQTWTSFLLSCETRIGVEAPCYCQRSWVKRSRWLKRESMSAVFGVCLVVLSFHSTQDSELTFLLFLFLKKSIFIGK